MTGPWICDTCGELIENPEDGVLQYLARTGEAGMQGRDPIIVHHATKSPRVGRSGCYHNQDLEFRKDKSVLSDMTLDRLTGLDGLVRLLTLSECNQLPSPELNRIIMRLHVPGYEQARRYFDAALNADIVDTNLPEGYFLVGQIQRIIAAIPELEGDSE
jgi:hypothetical protein